jgi:hypothetical protein
MAASSCHSTSGAPEATISSRSGCFIGRGSDRYSGRQEFELGPFEKRTELARTRLWTCTGVPCCSWTWMTSLSPV